MRPEHLIISAWGPYRDRAEIDFTKFQGRGLFLITGATGAGKTTVFDAITYALYGALSGQMRDKASVRSDFAQGDVPTFVELTMCHGGQQYRILRNPEYLRPKKRKSGGAEYTREKENAVLYLPDGKTVEGTREVNARMLEILVLDYQQFKQISMLAQGEFSRMLTASPKEKVEIFREIFGTGIYEKFTQNLRGKASELYVRAAEQKHKLEEDIRLLLESGEQEEHSVQDGGASEGKAETGVGISEKAINDSCYEKLRELTESDNWNYEAIRICLEQWKKRLGQTIKENNLLYTAADEQAHKLTEELAMQRELNRKLEQWREICVRLSDLTGQEKSYEEKEQRLKRAGAAAEAEPHEIRLQALLTQEKQSKVRLQALTKEMEQLAEDKVRLQPYGDHGTEAESYLQAVEQAGQLEKQFIDCREKKAVKDRQYQQAGEAYLEAEQERDRTRREYEEADKAYKHAAIGIAARMLVPGRPCPVCGSTEHPAPAPQEQGVLSEEELKSLKRKLEQRERELLKQHGQAVELKAAAEALEEQGQELARQLQELKETCEAQRQTLAGYGIDGESLTKAGLRDKIRGFQQIDGEQQSRQKQRQDLERELSDLSGQIREKEKNFREALRENGFADEKGVADREAYLAAKLPATERQKLEKTIAVYHETVAGAVSLKEHLEKEVQGRERADVESTEAKLQEIRSRKETVRRRQERYGSLADAVEKTLNSMKEKQKKLEQVGQEYGYVKDLENLASGNNAKKLVFEQYVLAGYFEQILQAANLRFAKMSGGRYEMSRLEEVGDGRVKDNLEIQVMDYYTGKMRSVRTLSGGESFKASLSLALGLSDVIQAMSGGIRVDVLFVDEGFGALDSESLDQACETLQGLVENDRMIGIISHVQELRERIDHQIVVEKTSRGSSVREVLY